MNTKVYIEGANPKLLTMPNRGSNGGVVFLDHKLTNSEARINNETKQILTNIVREAIVSVFHDFFYRVDFGLNVRPQYHLVSHDFYCSCALADNCPAVVATKEYLRKGGELANTPRPGYFLTAPRKCPTCGAKASYHPQLSSRIRGIGWICEKGGTSHYWQHELAVLQAAYAEKWKHLGVDPATFKKEVSGFNFKDGYDPERDSITFCPGRNIADPQS